MAKDSSVPFNSRGNCTGWGRGSFQTVEHLFIIKVKVKVKSSLEQATKAHRENSYSSFNLGARWGWVFNVTPQLFYRRLGRPQGRSGQVRKISPPPGFDSRTVRPEASTYTDWAIPASVFLIVTKFNLSMRVGMIYLARSLSTANSLRWLYDYSVRKIGVLWCIHDNRTV